MNLAKNRTKLLHWSKVFLVIFFSVGIAGFSWPPTFGLFQKLVPLNLMVGAALLFFFHPKWEKKQVFAFAAIAIAGFLAELIGIHTGILFGNYSYGPALGFKLFSTPLLIGLNWLMLVYAVYALLQKINHRWFFSFAGAGLLVIYDLVMEPVAMKTDMWQWDGGKVPLQNYTNWFVVALVMLAVLQVLKIKYTNPLAGWLLAVQFFFFVALSFTL